MRLAHLLLTHANPAQCSRLISRLACSDTDIYIHVDLKTNIGPFLHLKDSANVYFINDRVRVNWAGYSIVQATLNGLRDITASGKEYSHINLLSGQDYPLRSTEEIHKFYSANAGKNFMLSMSVEHEWPEAIRRITEYHLPDNNFPGKIFVLKILNTIAPKRKVPAGLIPVGKSQWFTITPASALYIINYLEQHPEVVRFFKRSWAPDEMIFQTILHNSPHKVAIVNDNLVYTDWSAGGASPKVLTMGDADKLLSSDKLFARKFSVSADSEILDYLDKHN